MNNVDTHGEQNAINRYIQAMLVYSGYWLVHKSSTEWSVVQDLAGNVFVSPGMLKWEHGDFSWSGEKKSTMCLSYTLF